jgi:hypothetical protein
MHSRVKERDKPVLALEGTGTSPMSTSSASCSQPAKEAGRADASRVNREVTPSNNSVDAEVVQPDPPRKSKRARADDVASSSTAESSPIPTDADGDVEIIGSTVTTPTTSSFPVASSASLTSSTAASAAPAPGTAPAKGSMSPPLLDVSPLPPSANDWAHIYVRSDKLLSRAKIDSRRDDVLQVQVKVDSRLPGCPTIDPLFYQYNQEAKRRFTAALLGGPDGFCIVAPHIPRFLVEKDSVGQHSLEGERLQWVTELRRQMKENGTMIRNMEGKEEDIEAACGILCKHMLHLSNSADGMPTPLWNDSEIASDWFTILAARSTASSRSAHIPTFSSSKDTLPPARAEVSYSLTLHASTPEAAFIIACSIASYTLMRRISAEVTMAMDAVLRARRATSASESADSTESSDSEGEWQKQRTVKNRARKAEKGKEHAFQKGLTDISKSTAMLTDQNYYHANTSKPFLGLAARVSMRAASTPYISFVIDNFQSLGCNIHNLANDLIFQRLTCCRPEFIFPSAYWDISHRIGNVSVSLWIREESRELPPELNDIARSILGIQSPDLRIASTVAKRKGRGRGLDFSNTEKIFFTHPTKIAPPPTERRVLPSAVGSSSASQLPLTAYSTKLLDGLKRNAEMRALNHRPRKEQRQSAPPKSVSPLAAPATKSTTKASQQQQQQNLVPPPSASAGVSSGITNSVVTMESIDARMAAFEARITQQLESRINSLISTQLNAWESRIQSMIVTVIESRMAGILDTALTRILSLAGTTSSLRASVADTSSAGPPNYQMSRPPTHSPVPSTVTNSGHTPAPSALADPVHNGSVMIDG